MIICSKSRRPRGCLVTTIGQAIAVVVEAHDLLTLYVSFESGRRIHFGPCSFLVSCADIEYYDDLWKNAMDT